MATAISSSASRARLDRSRYRISSGGVSSGSGCDLPTHLPLGGYPAIHSSIGKREAYRSILSSLLSDNTHDSPTLIAAYLRAAAEQSRFVTLLWFFCAVEGWLTGRVIRRYGDYPDGSFLRGFCDRFLLKNVSEWQILFTTLSLRSDDP
jgi:hypothetical protein